MKRKNTYFIANIIIIILILVGFSGIQLNEYSYYKHLAQEEAKKEVSLTSNDINAKIEKISSDQRVASEMMAHDIYLIEWCEAETEDTDSDQAKQLYKYLTVYKELFDYDVVFFVSNKTYNYYYNDGLNKVISPGNDFDKWYFDLIESGDNYNIQIDKDEINANQLTLFVNCIVRDKDGNILGVVGVGNNTTSLKKSLDSLVINYGVEISIVNIDTSHSSFDGGTDYFKTIQEAAEAMDLSEVKASMRIINDDFSWSEGNNCYSIRHNSELNWNVIVKKDATIIINGLLRQTYNRILFLIIIISIYILVSFTFLARMRRISARNENTDEVTGIVNNKYFTEEFEILLKKKAHKRTCSYFVLDVDNFKDFNDNYGHLYGNTILHLVAFELKEIVGNEGLVARWGGDEFVGYIYKDAANTKILLDKLQDILNNKDTRLKVSFSGGITQILPKDTKVECFKRADAAVYRSKDCGKAQTHIFPE